MSHPFLVALPILIANGGLLDPVYDQLNWEMRHLYLALPPALEGLVLNINHDTAWMSAL